MFEIGPFEYQFKKNSKKIFTKQNISIQEKEFVLITGASGSGKSTLLSILKGIIPRFTSGKLSGEIHYKGKPLDGEYFNQNLKEILYLFQNPFSQLIYPNVPEEFFFTMENFNFTREQMEQKKEELKGQFDVEAFWNRQTSELSHGECQKLVLASLLAIGPQVLLLDEPTAFLDPIARAGFYKWLKNIKGLQTIIVVDHHVNEILPLADKVLIVDSNGEISQLFSGLSDEQKSLIAPVAFRIAIPLKNLFVPSKESVLLELSQVCFHYLGQKALLNEISLKLSEGEVLVIKGANGKGKSTLLKIIAGLIRPKSGKVSMMKNNKLIHYKNYFKEVGFIFQNPESHFFYDTIEEELNAADGLEAPKELLEIFLKDVDFKRSPFLLSEGEKRRLSILMTIMMNKSIFLYDEPTFGQDQESISLIREMIIHLKAMGKVQILISHDDKFIESLHANVFELVEGRLEKLS
jgi:energy-coupling factor transport system ATP-binding protein